MMTIGAQIIAQSSSFLPCHKEIRVTFWVSIFHAVDKVLYAVWSLENARGGASSMNREFPASVRNVCPLPRKRKRALSYSFVVVPAVMEESVR